MDMPFVITNGSSREDILANFADQYINEVPRMVSFDIVWGEDAKVNGTITVAIRGLEHESGTGHDFNLKCGVISASGHAAQWVKDVLSAKHQATLKVYFNTKRRFGGFTLNIEQPVPAVA